MLTTGCIADVMRGIKLVKPVVQILRSRLISGGGEQPERYRLWISDGKYSESLTMFTTHLCKRHSKNDLAEFTVVRMDRYTTSVVDGGNGKGVRKAIIIFEFRVLKPGAAVGGKIGNPQLLMDVRADGGSAVASSSAVTFRTESARSVSNVAAHQNHSMGDSRVSSGGDRMSLKNTSPYPISSLSPYQSKWVIRARVMSKSSVRTWSNAKGEGRLFWMDIMDESGGIRVTAFNEQCDRYYDMIEVDKVYYISKCNVKQANKQYSSFKNDYEVTMTNDTIIQECKDAGSFKPSMQYSFVPISQIGTMEANAIIDVIGVCKEAGDVIQFTARSTGRELKKREVILVDKSNVAVPLILWGVDAQNFNASSNPVLVIKGVRVYEFGGSKKLGLIASSVMNIDPDIEEAHRMRGWYLSGGCDIVIDSASNRTAIGAGFSAEWLTFHDAKEMKLGTGNKADFFHVRAVVRNIKSANAVYKACPQPNCNKKVIDQGNGQYRCEKCNASFPDFKYRLLVNMLLCDWTSNRWVTAFTDLAEQMLGASSQDIGNALESNAREAERIFCAIHFKSYVFKLRTKVEHYGDAPRNKTIAVAAVDKLNHKEYNAYLIQNIQKLTGVGKQ